MPLTDTSVCAARPQTKPIRIYDAGGLYLKAQRALAGGLDPGDVRTPTKIAQTHVDSFEAIAREWYAPTEQRRTVGWTLP